MDRYIGLDAHSSSCTVAVVGPSGRRLQSKVLETNARMLIDFLKTVPRPRHLCMEEGTHSGWLYEMLAPHVDEIVVVAVGKRRGSKSDHIDAFGLAESHRVGSIERRIYKGLGEWGDLRELSRAYAMVVTPYRFSSKRAFWSYAGLGIVMRSSSDWVRAQDGSWARMAVQQTRGLNRNHNHTLKSIFKGAATSVLQWSPEDDPLVQHYRQLLAGGTKPNLARLTLARQVASIALSMWRSKEVYNPSKLRTAAWNASWRERTMVKEPDDACVVAGDETVSGESIQLATGPGRSVRSPQS